MIGQAERLIELDKLNTGNSILPLKKVITFSSGKGGTGKTFLSLNFAFALSKLNKKVLYLDLDLNFANSNIFLNIIPKYTIDHFFGRKKLFKEIIHQYNPNLHFIFGESGNAQTAELSSENLNMLFTFLAGKTSGYDFIIIDTGSGGQKSHIKLLGFASLNIIVTQPEPTAVMDAYVMIKLLNANKFKGRNYILMNKCFNKAEAYNAFKNIETASGHFLGENIKMLGLISADEIVGRTVNSQELLIENYPNHNLSQKIRELAAALADITQMANIPQSSKPQD
jgi:flagellar biosynthesis protein FlhG